MVSQWHYDSRKYKAKKDLAFTTLCAEIRKITNWIKIVLKLLNIFKCQKINDFLTIVKKICHVSLNFHFFLNFCILWRVWQSNHILPSKQPCCTRSEQDNYWQNVSTGIKILSSSVLYRNKGYQILSAGIYILWLYQYHDSAIHPQRNGLNLTEYLQHFLQT